MKPPTCVSSLAGINLLLANSKLILCPFCFFDKIDSPFCLQNCFFLLAAHVAQILLSKFCQGLLGTDRYSHINSAFLSSEIWTSLTDKPLNYGRRTCSCVRYSEVPLYISDPSVFVRMCCNISR